MKRSKDEHSEKGQTQSTTLVRRRQTPSVCAVIPSCLRALIGNITDADRIDASGLYYRLVQHQSVGPCAPERHQLLHI